VNEQHLKEIFGNYGKVKRVELVADRKTNISRGFAYVEFETREEAETAQSHFDGGQIDGNVVKCSFILVPRRPSPRPFRRNSPPRRGTVFNQSISLVLRL